MSRQLLAGHFEPPPLWHSAIHSFWWTALLLVWAIGISAQTARKPAKNPPPSALKLVSIKVTGTKRYTQDDVIAASGLAIGRIVSEDDFKRSSQRLAETGAFSDVAYSFQYSQGASLELHVTDSNQFVPAYFDNFVWLSDQELLAKLHALTPLFNGQLPLAGNLADQVSEDLQAILAEGDVPGRPNYLREGPENGPVDAILFTIADTNIRVRNINFTGAGAAELPALQTAAERMQGKEYSRASLRTLADKNLLSVYRSRGYLKAAIGEPQAKVGQQTPQQTDVDISYAVDPGRQYQVADIQLLGAKAVPLDQLRGMIHLQPGNPADAVRLAKDVDAMRKMYGVHGYMAASIQALPAMDDGASSVSYRVLIDEGEQYHMGELEIRGLDSRVTARLAAAWKLHEGDAYDASYPDRFAEEARSQLPGDWAVSVHQTPDAKDRTVDVSLRFERKS